VERWYSCWYNLSTRTKFGMNINYSTVAIHQYYFNSIISWKGCGLQRSNLKI
jgi:hypothetical protein